MTNYKSLFYGTFGSLLAVLLLMGGLVVWIDPYQRYRASEKYIGNQRLEIAGVAHTHDYNTFFTGSSMAMNHSPEQVDSLFEGWHTKNFSIMGATYDDYQDMMPYILGQGKVKHIINDLDFFSFARNRRTVDAYLYNDNLWDDYEYLYNFTTFKNCWVKCFSPVGEKGLYHFKSPNNPEVLKAAYEKTKNGKAFEGEYFDYASMKDKFDRYYLPLVQDEGKDVEWYIYFPPYSIYEFVAYQDYGYLEDILRFKAYMITRLLPLDNVRLYDFQCEPWITNAHEYMDLRHHSIEYNRQIIEAIRKDEYRVSEEEYQAQVDSLKELVVNFK